MKMEKGNVLVIGNSGVGKSTLINAVLGEQAAKTGWGTSGTTDRLEIYEPRDESVPFNVIDTIGFEPGYFKEARAVSAIRKWSRGSAKKGGEDHQINVIWFCVDGTSRKLFPTAIRALSRATAMWESVPVIVVITKSYSVPERAENIELVHNAFAAQKKHGSNVKRVIPVVAETYVLNENAFAAPEGISELIDLTNSLMPEGQKAAEQDLAKFVLGRRRALAQTVVTASTAAGIVVGAVPIPFPDAVILTPTEVAEVNAIARIYGIEKDEKSKQFLNSIVEAGTVGVAAKGLINALKAIPGVNLGAAALNAVIAGVIIAALGEGAVYAFEQIYLGNRSIDDVDWVRKIVESRLGGMLGDKAKPILERLKDTSDRKAVLSAVLELARSVMGPKDDREP